MDQSFVLDRLQPNLEIMRGQKKIIFCELH